MKANSPGTGKAKKKKPLSFNNRSSAPSPRIISKKVMVTCWQIVLPDGRVHSTHSTEQDAEKVFRGFLASGEPLNMEE